MVYIFFCGGVLIIVHSLFKLWKVIFLFVLSLWDFLNYQILLIYYDLSNPASVDWFCACNLVLIACLIYDAFFLALFTSFIFFTFLSFLVLAKALFFWFRIKTLALELSHQHPLTVVV